VIRVGDLALYGNRNNPTRSLAVVTGDNSAGRLGGLLLEFPFPHFQFYHVRWGTIEVTEKQIGFLEVVEVP